MSWFSKLLGHQGGPCASSKQAVASSKQASPAAPFAGPRATGVPKSKKMLPPHLGWCWDDKQSLLGLGRPVSRPPKCSVRPSGRARGRTQVAPGGPPVLAPSGPNMAQNHQKRAPVPPWADPEGSVVQVDGMDKINLDTVWVTFRPCLDPCGPETVSVGPKMCSFGPRMCPVG